MQTQVIKINPDEPDLAKIEQVARLIDTGKLVAFPTETVYGIACRVKKDLLDRLDTIKAREPGKRYSLHIGRQDDLHNYIPNIGLRAKKLIEKAWPGPLTIVFELNQQDIEKVCGSLGREVFENLYKDNTIGIRCPDQPIASKLLQLTQNPVVAPSANMKGCKPAFEPNEVLEQLSGQIDFLLDAGPCKYEKSSTVVKIGKKKLQILRPGFYSQAQLEQMSEVKFLLVCTGNTCRSPMAAGIFRKFLAEKLQCELDELEKNGYKVGSAGMLDMNGAPASPEAIMACAGKGIDIRKHASQALTNQLISESDFIFVMSRLHYQRIISLSAEAESKCKLLAENKEIDDPIGQVQQIYNNCADTIEEAVKRRISELII